MSSTLTPDQALARLAQYQERPVKTWSTASYSSSDEQSLAEIARSLAEEVQRLRALVSQSPAPQSPGVHPLAQQFADQALGALNASGVAHLRDLARVAELLPAPVIAPDTRQIDQLGTYLDRLAAEHMKKEARGD